MARVVVVKNLKKIMGREIVLSKTAFVYCAKK